MPGPFDNQALTPSMVYGSATQARVIDTDDPLKIGRVQIRLPGQDAIPKSQCQWVKAQGSQFSGVGGHGETSHQFLIGQYVQCALGPDNQVVHITGSINAPAQGGGDGSGGGGSANDTGTPIGMRANDG